jgi:hypothetical protein
MNPHDKWCHNPRCRAYGRPGEGHVVIHSLRRSAATNANAADGPSPRQRVLPFTGHTSPGG